MKFREAVNHYCKVHNTTITAVLEIANDRFQHFYVLSKGGGNIETYKRYTKNKGLICTIKDDEIDWQVE